MIPSSATNSVTSDGSMIASSLRLVGPEEQPGQEVCRDGGKAEAARHEAEHGEDRHRHGQLAESQRRSLRSVRRDPMARLEVAVP